MKGDLIIIDKLLVSKNTLMGDITLVEMEATGSHTQLSMSQTNLTPPKVIANTTAYFKRMTVSTPVETSMLTSIIKVPFVSGVVSISTSVSSFLSSISSVFFSFLIKIGDGILPKK